MSFKLLALPLSLSLTLSPIPIPNPNPNPNPNPEQVLFQIYVRTKNPGGFDVVLINGSFSEL